MSARYLGLIREEGRGGTNTLVGQVLLLLKIEVSDEDLASTQVRAPPPSVGQTWKGFPKEILVQKSQTA